MGNDILLFGGNGQVGWELRRSLAPLGRLVVLDRAGCDLNDPDALLSALRAIAPRLIVNAAAYTAVDKAESEAAAAARINAAAPGIMAAQARRQGIPLIHYSTDYVFDGKNESPYTETDATAAQSVYGRSKREGELAIEASGASAVIFRTSWVFGAHGANFVKTILRLAREKESLRVVDDQIGSPTPAALIADITALAIHRWRASGWPAGTQYFNLCAADPVSWHGFATAIVERAQALGMAGLKLRPEAIAAIPTREYPLPAMRPANSRLDCRKLEQTLDLRIPPWLPYLERMLVAQGV